MTTADYKRILVRFPNWAGDAVMATPALRCLRQNYPKARIDVTLLPYVRQIVEGAPWFDSIIEFPNKYGSKGLAKSLV